MFNIYQAKTGCIYILMGNSVTSLTKSQIENLHIDLYSLNDYDHDLYIQYYGN